MALSTQSKTTIHNHPAITGPLNPDTTKSITSQPLAITTMPSTKSILAFVVLGLFANSAIAGTGWAQFCNDDNCSEGCGAKIDLENPGCLNQYGRKSIKFSGIIAQDTNLVASPNPGCDCQNYREETVQRVWTGVFDQRPSCFKLRDEPVSLGSLADLPNSDRLISYADNH